MPLPEYLFYQCTNLQCDLRFPGYEGYPKWNRCPLCRSSISIVETIPYIENNDNKIKRFGRLSVNVQLDNIRSAMNVGSIFRTSDGFGVDKVYLCGTTPTPDNAKVRKTALGAEKNVDWEQSNNGLTTAIQLQSQGYQLWALEDLPESLPIYDLDLRDATSPQSIVLIVGNELTGVDPGIIRISNKVISIPMVGGKSSFNVAIAFGIAISFIYYQSIILKSGKTAK